MQDGFSDLPNDNAPLRTPMEGATAPSFQDKLIGAIYENRLGDVLHSDPKPPSDTHRKADQTLNAKARAALLQINAEVDQHCTDIQARLAAAGVDTRRVTQATGLRQFHAFELGIERGALSTALRVLKDAQYPLAAALSSGAMMALDATETKLDLMQDTAPDMRLTLRGRGRGLARHVPHRLKPTLADLLAVQLPTGLWPLYFVIRPLRVLRTKLYRQTAPRTEVPAVLSHINLGTPQSLIAPLLATAGLSKDDRLVDYGCGDGRIISQAMRDYGCEVIGIEPNTALADIAKQSISNAPVGQSRVENRLGTPRDVAKASAVFLFQPMPLAAKLIPDLLAQMSSGGRLVMHEQATLHPDLKPDRSVPVFSDNALTVAHIWHA